MPIQLCITNNFVFNHAIGDPRNRNSETSLCTWTLNDDIIVVWLQKPPGFFRACNIEFVILKKLRRDLLFFGSCIECVNYWSVYNIVWDVSCTKRSMIHLKKPTNLDMCWQSPLTFVLAKERYFHHIYSKILPIYWPPQYIRHLHYWVSFL